MSELWHIATKDEIEDNLNTDFKRGMTNEFAQSRLKKSKTGNKSDKVAKKTALTYFSSVMAILLVILSVIFMLKDNPVLGTTVVVLVFISEVLGFLQEVVSYKTENKLKKMLKKNVVVIRDGEKKTINKDEIAQGDIVVLTKGDIVPCDGRITYCESLKVDEKCVTGVSEPIEKAQDAELDEETDIKDQKNMLFAGSSIISGNCTVVACRLGESTVLAQSEKGTLKENNKSYMQDKLSEVGKVLSVFTFALLAVLLVVGILSGVDMKQTVMLCLALGAVLVPSRLPVIISCAINKGMFEFAKKGNIVKNQAALEKLALCDVAVIGKTGIITEDKASVIGVVSTEGLWELKDEALGVPQKSILKIILEFAAVCTHKPEEKGIAEEHVVDSAVLDAANMLEVDIKDVDITERYPFDMYKKTMTVCADVGGGYRIITKGDVGEVISNCTNAVTSAGLEEMTDELKQELTSQYEEASKNGYKAVAVAYKDSDSLPEVDCENKDLTFLGIIIIENQVRKEAVNAAKTLLSAGIRPVLLTYDNALLAEYAAKQCGLAQEQNTVVTKDELDKMSDEELDGKIDSISVFAELTPCDKERIIKSLKKAGKTVCMLSASSYDQKAMDKADISASKNGGAEVNEDMSDVVTDGTLNGLADVMKQAQTLYLDTRRSLRFLVSSGIGQMLFVLFAMLLTNKIPLDATKVLLIGIITNGILAFVLPFGGAWDKQKLKNVKQNSSIFVKMWPRILLSGILMAILGLVIFIRAKYFIPTQSDALAYTKAQTSVFLFFVLYALFGTVALRINVFTLKEGKRELVTFGGIIATVLICLIVLLTVPVFKSIFGFLSFDAGLTIIFALVPFAIKLIEDVLKTKALKVKKAEDLNGTDI